MTNLDLLIKPNPLKNPVSEWANKKTTGHWDVLNLKRAATSST